MVLKKEQAYLGRQEERKFSKRRSQCAQIQEHKITGTSCEQQAGDIVAV